MVVRAIFGSVTLVGFVMSVIAGYLVVRGPFLGGPSLGGVPLLVAFGGFVLGIVVFAWGGVKALGVGVRL